MDLSSLSVSVSVMMACLLGAAQLSSGDNSNCPCPHIPHVNLTKPPPEGCFQKEDRYRYQCVEGYVRKVGTSDLSRCRPNEDGVLRWTEISLKCIRVVDSVTQTTGKTGPIHNCTALPSNRNNSTTTSPWAHKGEVDSVTLTQTTQKSTVSRSNANSSTTTSPGTRKAPTSTSLQTTLTASTFSTVTEQRDGLPDGKIDSVTLPVVQNQTIRTSTISPSTLTNYTISPPETLKGEIVRAVSISGFVVVCILVGIGFSLYRRRSRRTSFTVQTEEMMPMNCPPAKPEEV
ncbi:interleukin-15 receptor subunit alpha [Stegastes partitus]|uniref:Interleukin-15 receptor subunit alpha-like n=1 Tax=Stegastes partitus TaxID=144197 RepID=A0A3B4Z922_9TELE|nr:PREDICTED: interleukin-15 receptor subunit alpha-like [Stegastes partitus]XP_008285215.1 PREDICTED: interleukin-15 receptor subunit alpha-like [Stegastes partitus]XP_008285216.1 PREDICTED: interleukin-15 receptor subunit alpha-like [Stegastes partitus]